MKTVRGESGRYLRENILGIGNSKEVILLGPWVRAVEAEWVHDTHC